MNFNGILGGLYMTFTDKEIKIVATTVLTILLFGLLSSEIGFVCSLFMFLSWFIVWCVVNMILYLVHTK